MVRHVCIVTLEEDHLSGQKQHGPRGLSCLSLSARGLRAPLMYADFAADDSFR